MGIFELFDNDSTGFKAWQGSGCHSLGVLYGKLDACTGNAGDGAAELQRQPEEDIRVFRM